MPENINSGIYSIRCLVNNKRYIGSCSNFKIRESEHFRKLRNNQFKNKYIQKDFNDFGEINFIFEIIEYLPSETDEELILLAQYENYFMDEYKTHIPTYGKKFGYNIRRANQILNNTKNKMSEIKKEQKNISGNKNPFFNKGELISKRQMGKNNPMYGKPAPNRNLSLEQYSKIKELILKYESTIKKKELFSYIGKLVGVSPPTISRIYYKTHWSCKEYE